MNESVALDTNIVIDLLNSRSGVVALLNQYRTIYLPATVCGELLFGAKNSAKSLENEAKCLSFIKSCRVLNVNELVAEQYANTRKRLKTKGRPIPENDIWIAATCIVHNIALATFDSDFQHVEDLNLLDLTPLAHDK